jgi:hypothetical protein
MCIYSDAFPTPERTLSPVPEQALIAYVSAACIHGFVGGSGGIIIDRISGTKCSKRMDYCQRADTSIVQIPHKLYDSTLLNFRMCRNAPLLQQVVPMPVTSVLLPPEKEDRSRDNHSSSDTSKCVKHDCRPFVGCPIIHKV